MDVESHKFCFVFCRVLVFKNLMGGNGSGFGIKALDPIFMMLCSEKAGRDFGNVIDSQECADFDNICGIHRYRLNPKGARVSLASSRMVASASGFINRLLFIPNNEYGRGFIISVQTFAGKAPQQERKIHHCKRLVS